MKQVFDAVLFAVNAFRRLLIGGVISISLLIQPLQAQPNSAELVALIRQARQKPITDQINLLPSLIQAWNQNNLPQDSIYVSMYIDLARALYLNGQIAQSIFHLHKAEAAYLSKNANLNLEELLKIYFRLGYYQRLLNQFSASIESTKKGINVAQTLPPSRWTSLLYGSYSFLVYQQGDYEQALSLSDQAIISGQLSHDDYGQANGHYEKGKALYKLQRFFEARKSLLKSVSIARQSKQPNDELVYYYKTLAYVNKSLGDTLLGISYFNKAVELLKQRDDNFGIGETYLDLGFFLWEIKRYKEAIRPLEEAIRIHPSVYGKALAYDNLGAVYWQLKQYPKALQTYQKGLAGLPLKCSTAIDDLPTAADIRLLPYKNYIFTLILDKADTWLDYARTTKNPAHYRNALKTYQLVDEVIDLMRWEHTGTGSKLYWRQKTRPIYERAIETCFQLRDSRQAFRFFEKSRAVLLTDKLNELGARQQLSPLQVARETDLMQTVSQLQSELSGKRADSPPYDSVRTNLLNAQDKLDEFRQQLEKSNPEYYRLKYDNSVKSLPEVQQWLETQDASLLTYFVGEQSLYVLGVRPGEAIFRKLPAAPYRRAAAGFMQRLVDGQRLNREFAPFVRSAHHLYAQLVAPLHLPKGRVVVTPDGLFLPLEALSRSAQQPDFLVKDYAFSYAYSAHVLLKQRPDSTTTDRDFLGMAPVSYAPKLAQANLSGSDAVMKGIGGFFGKPSLLTGPDATRRAFVNQASQYRVVQLFTHADADSSGREPVIYFADSTLRLSELEAGSMPNVQLLGLSACKTGVGTNQQGEGVFSLARGFASLGVPSILTTLWSVESRATYDLTHRFHAYLAEGLPKDVALQRARLDYLQTADRSGSLPDRWAGLILVGNAEPLVTRSFNQWWLAAGLGGLLAAGIGFWLIRRKPISQPATH